MLGMQAGISANHSEKWVSKSWVPKCELVIIEHVSLSWFSMHLIMIDNILIFNLMASPFKKDGHVYLYFIF